MTSTLEHPKLNISQLVDKSIEQAMVKLEITNSNDLCRYIPYEEGHLHHKTFTKMRKYSPEELYILIQKHILKTTPQKFPSNKKRPYRTKARVSQHIEPTPRPDEKPSNLAEAIARAMNRKNLNLNHEEEICRFIPRKNNYLHPLAFRSLKKKDPQALIDMIQTYVLVPKTPKRIQRTVIQAQEKASSQNKLEEKLDQLQEQIRLLKEMQTITQQKSNSFDQSPTIPTSYNQNAPIATKHLYLIQNQLVRKILNKEIDHDLWNLFVELIKSS